MQFIDELQWRGLLHQTTGGAELQEHLSAGSRIAYCGFDPTKDALTIGNYLPIKMFASLATRWTHTNCLDGWGNWFNWRSVLGKTLNES